MVARTQSFTRSLQSTTRPLQALSSQVTSTRMAVAGLLTGVAALGTGGLMLGVAKSFVNVSSEIQNYETRLKVLTGSQKIANSLFKEMKQYAMGTPFEFRDVMDSATSLAGILSPRELIAWMPLIGDLAAASGLGIKESTEQIQRGLSAGAASMDLFQQRGVNAMMGFRAGVSYTAEETRRMLVNSWLSATSKFKGATGDLQKTWEGQMSMLSDAWFEFRKQVMDAGVFQFLMNGIQRLTAFIENNSTAVIAVIKKHQDWIVAAAKTVAIMVAVGTAVSGMLVILPGIAVVVGTITSTIGLLGTAVFGIGTLLGGLVFKTGMAITLGLVAPLGLFQTAFLGIGDFIADGLVFLYKCFVIFGLRTPLTLVAPLFTLQGLTGLIGGAVTGVGLLSQAFTKMGVRALFAVLAPLAPLVGTVLVIGTIVAGIYAMRAVWKQNFLGIQETMANVVHKLKEIWHSFWTEYGTYFRIAWDDWVKPFLDMLWTSFKACINNIIGGWMAIGAIIWSVMEGDFAGALDKGLGKLNQDYLKGFWDTSVVKLKELGAFTKEVFGAVKEQAREDFSSLQNTFNGVIEKLKSGFAQLPQFIKDKFPGVSSWITGLTQGFGNLKDDMQKALKLDKPALYGSGNSPFKSLTDSAKDAKDSVKDLKKELSPAKVGNFSRLAVAFGGAMRRKGSGDTLDFSAERSFAPRSNTSSMGQASAGDVRRNNYLAGVEKMKQLARDSYTEKVRKSAEAMREMAAAAAKSPVYGNPGIGFKGRVSGSEGKSQMQRDWESKRSTHTPSGITVPQANAEEKEQTVLLRQIARELANGGIPGYAT